MKKIVEYMKKREYNNAKLFGKVNLQTNVCRK